MSKKVGEREGEENREGGRKGRREEGKRREGRGEESASKQLFSGSCLQVSNLSPGPDLLQWWAVTRECKPNKPFPLQVATGHSVCHSKRIAN